MQQHVAARALVVRDEIMIIKCPICDKRFPENDAEAALPFCSMRCKMIDAARWLNEAYGLPEEKMHEEPDWEEE
ncbi:MAG: DNA gyrase inhibitor YacG [Planctomycetaceae bacterium]|jgi:endogenous inhibitor of DNA gyrase (YacG/DUF329 family)|nr:DNA gyrase inhibitor YacG [Planctomycetaceae bacterium]